MTNIYSIEIKPGIDCCDSCDWAHTLCQMYISWATKKGYEVDVQKGILSSSLRIEGADTYKLMKENGVHSRTHNSLFDEKGRRCTSFAEVKVTPFTSPIRSYVLHPYEQVKDMRTGISTKDVQSVLGGGIDIFLEGKED